MKNMRNVFGRATGRVTPRHILGVVAEHPPLSPPALHRQLLQDKLTRAAKLQMFVFCLSAHGRNSSQLLISSVFIHALIHITVAEFHSQRDLHPTRSYCSHRLQCAMD